MLARGLLSIFVMVVGYCGAGEIDGIDAEGVMLYVMWFEESADKMQRLVSGIGPEPIKAMLVDGERVKPVDEIAASSKRVRCS